MNQLEKKTPEQEVIAFLRSMLKLLERRGLRYVDQQFGLSMTAMANAILKPEDFRKASRHSDAINAAAGLIDEFSVPHSRGVPVSVLKAVAMVIEEALQEPEPDYAVPVREEAGQ